jgi:hypothetical protein
MAKTETSSSVLTARAAAEGPLIVSDANPRYFAVRSATTGEERVVYLTGSHVWNNFHDGAGPGAACADPPEQNDYRAYLAFLKEHGHNFIRLWRWEHFRSQVAGDRYHFCMTPQPWSRTGPGAAKDGKPRFDLSSLDPAYFERLRDRVIAAGNDGIYVSVMLFEGFGLHLTSPPDNIEGHPFHVANNVNGVGIASIIDYQVLPLDPRVQNFQKEYVRRVVDTVHDLPNVLYEVVNESSGDRAESVRLPDGSVIATPVGDSTEWQYWVIDVVKRYEEQSGYDRHPIGMTMQYPVPDQTKGHTPLFRSHADWISPGFDEVPQTATPGEDPPPGRWLTDPPVGDGAKVVITDTDHYAPGKGDALYFGIIDVVKPLDPSAGVPSYDSFEPARHAMGDTLRYAERMKLIDMEPCGELTSTGYALADPGREYLVLQPDESANPFTVELAPGTYSVEWYNVRTRETADGGDVTIHGDRTRAFISPFGATSPAVVYLKLVAS